MSEIQPPSARRGPPPPLDYRPPQDPWLQIVHRDEQLLALHKPAGLLSVPGKAPAHRDCLETRAQRVLPTARIIHRLDMDTSGLILMALTPHALRHVGLQFEKRQTRKTYVALVAGQLMAEEGVVDLPLRCDWPRRPLQMVCHQQGRPARTRWQVLARHDSHTRVALYPETGRSHQLRVHMLSLGHPILGDRFYGDEAVRAAAPRLMLHAQHLSLRHPDGGKWLDLSAEAGF